jgi:hypothetical protein
MKIADGIETGRRYHWKRTDGWTWFDGTTRWWEIDVEINGINGLLGLWIVEFWHWNGSAEILRRQPRTLSRDESMVLVRDIQRNLGILAEERPEQPASGGGRRG